MSPATQRELDCGQGSHARPCEILRMRRRASCSPAPSARRSHDEDPRIPGQGNPPQVRRADAARHRRASASTRPSRPRSKLGGKVWVVKAQIHAGGRGKGGGVKVAKSIDEVRSTRERDPRHAAEDAPDRPRRPEGAPPADRGRRGHREGALRRHGRRPRHAARRADGLERRRHGHRGSRRARRRRRSTRSRSIPRQGLHDSDAEDVARKIGVPDDAGARRRATSCKALYKAFDETDARSPRSIR